MVLAAAGSISLSALLTYFLIQSWWSPTLGDWIALACVIAFWTMSGLAVKRSLCPTRLTLDRNGFQLSNHKRVVRWEEVEEFKKVYLTYSLWRQRPVFRDRGLGVGFVGWVAKDASALSMHRTVNLSVAGVAGTFPPIHGLKSPELVTLMEGWRTRFGSGTARTA